MNYLAIDASTEACSVALNKDGQLYHEFELCPQSHSLLLLPMVDKILKQANCQLIELDGLIYGRGPGSFTGVRIGIGVAQGLGFANDLPLVGVSTLQAMAQSAYDKHQQTQVIAAIDARMAEIYTCAYQLGDNGIMQPLLKEAVLPPAEAKAHFHQQLNQQQCQGYSVGTGWQSYAEELAELKLPAQLQTEPEILYPDALSMLAIGAELFAAGEAVSAEQAQPVYVRDTVSWKKLPGRG